MFPHSYGDSGPFEERRKSSRRGTTLNSLTATEHTFSDLFLGGGELAQQMLGHDWTGSPLGPPDSWPQPLRAMVRILLTSRY